MGQEIKEQIASPETRHHVIAVTPSQGDVMEASQPTPTTLPVRRTFMMPRHLLDKPWNLVAACIQAFVMVACLWAGPANANEDEKKVQGRFAYIIETIDTFEGKEYPNASAACTALLSSPWLTTPEGLKAAGSPDEDGDVRCQGTEGFDMYSNPVGYRLLCPANTRVGSMPPNDTRGCECDSGFVARGGTTCVPREEAAAEGAKGLTKADFPKIATEISQKQLRHIAGRPELAARGGGGYLNSTADAQAVLDTYHSGSAMILGKTPQGFPVVRVEGVTGTNINVGAGFLNQPTNVFIIKGTAKPSIVPTNPYWKP